MTMSNEFHFYERQNCLYQLISPNFLMERQQNKSMSLKYCVWFHLGEELTFLHFS